MLKLYKYVKKISDIVLFERGVTMKMLGVITAIVGVIYLILSYYTATERYKPNKSVLIINNIIIAMLMFIFTIIQFSR